MASIQRNNNMKTRCVVKIDPLPSWASEREALYKSDGAKFGESYNLQSERRRGGTISDFILQEEVEKIDRLNVGLLPTCWGKNEKITKSSRLFFFCFVFFFWFPTHTTLSDQDITSRTQCQDTVEQQSNTHTHTHTFIAGREKQRGSYMRCEIAFFFFLSCLRESSATSQVFVPIMLQYPQVWNNFQKVTEHQQKTDHNFVISVNN